MSGKKKSSQGRPLPADGTELSAYPIGCCVLTSFPGSPSQEWFLIAFRIGGVGCGDEAAGIHLRRLEYDPHAPGWEYSQHDTRETRVAMVASSSCWPFRRADADSVGEERDPLLARIGSTDGGDPSTMYKGEG